MPENYWSKDESDQDLDPISSFLEEWTDSEDEEEEFKSDFFQGLEGRRSKAAFTLMIIWAIVIALHLVSWGSLFVWIVSGTIFLQALSLTLIKPQSLSDNSLNNIPFVSLLVAAKNEEAVIAKLVHMLFQLDYPKDQYEVWIIDDHSTDKTPEILDQLTTQYPHLKVMRRHANASGGKSGALNQVLAKTQGAIIGVFDADAIVTPDLLHSVVPMFENTKIGAVQVRKAIANGDFNFWTKGQMAEMALDSYFQQQRIAMGGIGELRGNGQFVRRDALTSCGGWNEQTITDDLDLTIRLHLDQWDISFLSLPAVKEEGVKKAVALWHQRSRWAEGGYQRYLDYWRLLLSQRLDVKKKLDLFLFVIIQYFLPTASIPDLLMAITRHRLPILSPLSTVMLSLAAWGMFIGLIRTNSQNNQPWTSFLNISLQTIRGMIYMLHWLIVMPATTARMAIRPKRLKWVKTVHQGSNEETLEFPS